MDKYKKSEMTQWSENIQNVCGEFKTSFDKQPDLFIGEVQSFLLGETEIVFIKSNGVYFFRKKGMVDRVNDRFCFLVLQHTGKMRIAYKDQDVHLNEGDIALLDPNETIEMYPQGLFTHISVHLSREKLFRQGITTDYFGKLVTSNMSGHLLKCLLQSLSAANIELWYAKEDGEAFEDALIALIKPTIHYKNIEMIDHHRLKAERFILENLALPNLNAQMIADHLHISLRQLYRLFKNEDISIHKYIQMRRLEKVQYELKDNKNKNLSITQMAMQCGFGDSAHFSKLFRKTVGISPKAFRAKT